MWRRIFIALDNTQNAFEMKIIFTDFRMLNITKAIKFIDGHRFQKLE